MRLRSLGILTLLFGTVFGCQYEEETFEEEETFIPEESSSEKPQEAPPSGSPPVPSDDDWDDEEFDPCPEVKYTLLEHNGLEVVVVIEVFCEPIQNLNLGCPGPGLQGLSSSSSSL
jgi:hypothetical protein